MTTASRGLATGAQNDRSQYLRLLLFSSLVAIIGLAAIAFDVPTASAEPAPVGISGNWGLRFDEEFTSPGLNTSVWTPGWYRNGLWETNSEVGSVYGCSENVQQPGDGYLHLHIRALGELPTNSPCRTSPQLTVGASVEANPLDGVSGHTGFQFSYGVIEWKVWLPGVESSKCPTGGCVADWPALWTSESTTTPEAHWGEIDTTESLNPLCSPSSCETFSEPAYHVHPPYGGGEVGGFVSGSYAGWHTFSADWEPNTITYRYDGNVVGEVPNNAGAAPEFPVMTIVRNAHSEPSKVPTEMLVDYVRVWQHIPAPQSSSWATENTLDTNINTFYKNSSNQLADEYLLPIVEWQNEAFSVGNFAGQRTAIENVPATNINTFYRTPTGELADQYLTAGIGWRNRVLVSSGVEGTPSATEKSDSSNINVFYRTPSGQLADEHLSSGSEWTNTILVNSGVAGNPAAVENITGSNINVFYKTTSGQLGDEYLTENVGWQNRVFAEAGGVEGTPAATVNTDGTNINAFYRTSSGQLADEHVTVGTEWTNTVLVGSGVGGSPGAVENLTGSNINTFYRTTAGQLADEYLSAGIGWQNTVLVSSGVEANPAPAAVEVSDSSNINAFYKTTGGQLADEYLTAGIGWRNRELASGMLE
jgi:Glycosyl hydrolases family 16